MGCSLALATIAIAQQPEGQESPAKGGRGQKTTTSQGANETKTKSNAAETRGNRGRGAAAESNATQPTTTGNETGTTRGGKRGRGAKAENANTTGAETAPAGTNATNPTTTGGGKGRHGRNATTNTAAETGASPSASAPMETGKKGKQGRGQTAGTSPTAAPSAPANMSPTGSTTNAATRATPMTSATVAAGANAATTNTAATNTTAEGNLKGQGTVGRGGKRVEQQQVQQIKQQHASFRAQARPDKAPAVQFQENRRIEGAEHWQGPQYEVFRSYHPEWHDQGWYRQRYGRVELIGGGYYFFNNGYWYPAWGYDQSAAYYPYDGPIYVGHQTRPPDQVIADVQAELQEMGYYTGEVDGLLGPLTRQALRDYQVDHGLMVTEAIDEPTLDELQLG